jgi:lipopolysaccharide exporter
LSLSNRSIKSSMWILTMGLFQRGAGIISMIILARLLTPIDFGIVALTTILVFLFDTLSELGNKQYIISIDNVTDDDLNTAWTLNIVFKSIAWLLFLIAVPFIANYMDKPEIASPLYLLSLLLPIQALGNPGVWLYLRELNYRPFVKVTIVSKTIGFIVVISLAFIFKNYWAMIIGTLLGYLIPVIYSYIIHPYRPSISLKKITLQRKYSQWIILKGLVGYSRSQFDIILITKFFDLKIVGVYTMLKNISAIPGQQIILPLIEPLLAVFSKSKNDKINLSYQFNLALFIVLTLVMPVATILYTFHFEIIEIVLGKQWGQYSNLLAAMVFLLISISISGILTQVLIAVGKVKFIFYYDILSFIAAAGILIFLKGQSIEVFTWVRSLIAIFTSLFLLIFVISQLKTSFIHSFLLFTIPVISSLIAMYLTTLSVALLTTTGIIELIISCTLFSILYITALLSLLIIHDKPQEVIQLKIMVKNYTSKILSKIKGTK